MKIESSFPTNYWMRLLTSLGQKKLTVIFCLRLISTWGALRRFVEPSGTTLCWRKRFSGHCRLPLLLRRRSPSRSWSTATSSSSKQSELPDRQLTKKHIQLGEDDQASTKLVRLPVVNWQNWNNGSRNIKKTIWPTLKKEKKIQAYQVRTLILYM